MFFTVTPDRRHSALVWRLMRARPNDTGLLADDAATRWRRKYARADRPSLYIKEETTFTIDMKHLDIPTVREAIAMSARDPLSTVLHFDVCVRVILSYLAGIRMCFHCPRCSLDQDDLMPHEDENKLAGITPCQNKFGKNARLMGRSFGLAESLASAT